MHSFLWLTFVVAFFPVADNNSEINSDWFRHSAISPDGLTILFSYKGDIYRVAKTGGKATALTIHSAWEGHPVWSRDGKQIAFASDRHGNLDVFVMPADGGKAKRLTYHSADDVPSDFFVTQQSGSFSIGSYRFCRDESVSYAATC